MSRSALFGGLWCLVATLVSLLPADGVLSTTQRASFPIAETGESEFAADLAFDGTNFLVGIEGDANAPDTIGARLVSPSGSLIGSFIHTGCRGGAPYVAYDGTAYLLVWRDCPELGCNDDLWGTFVNPAGQTAPPFFVAGGPVHKIGGIACDGGSCLVVYFVEVNTATGDSKVYGRQVSTSGFVSPEITISTGFGDFGHKNVAFDGTNFLVVWTDDDNDTEVRGRFVDQSGTPGAELSINASGAHSDDLVTVVFDGTYFLVVWSDQVGGFPDGEWDLFGQRLDTSGNTAGGVIAISTAAGSQLFPCVASSGDGYLVTWTDMRNDVDGDFACDESEGTCLDIYGQYLNASGGLVGSELPITTNTGNQFVSPLAHGSSTYLVIWSDGERFDAEVNDVRGTFMPDSPCGQPPRKPSGRVRVAR